MAGIKKITTLLAFICLLLFIVSFSRQKHDNVFNIITIDSTPKPITFTTNLQQYNYIDSVLKLSLRVTGYELPAKDADALRAGMVSIINFLNYEYQRQMAVDTVKKPASRLKSDSINKK